MDLPDINLILPEEILYQVFSMLSPKDLKSAVLVCKWWAEVGQSPGLWCWVSPVVENSNLDTVVTKILLSRRLQSIKGLQLKVVSEELFQALARHPSVKDLDIDDSDLSPISSVSLVEIISKLTTAKLCSSFLSQRQASELFSALEHGLHLKRLVLWDVDLSSVNPDQFGRTLTQLEEVDLRSTELTPEQGEAIFANLGEGETKLKLRRLWVGSNNLSCVNAELMARGVNRLEVVDITGTWMKSHQVTSILNQSLVKTRLILLRLAILVADSNAAFATRANQELINLAKRVIKTVHVSFQF